MMKVSANVIERRLEAAEAVRAWSKERQRLIDELDVKPHIAEVYHGLHDDITRGDHEFFNLPGGRGSGKSSFCALEIVTQIMKDRSGLSNALIVRKWAVTLRGSVFSQIDWAINTLGVADRWQHTIMPLQFVYKDTGQVIRLTGLDDPQKLKSIKPSRGYFRFLWIEEFSEIVGEPELRNLQQSVLRGGDRFTVFRSFNPPISSANWANTFVNRPDDRAVTLLTTYKDIPAEWLGQGFIDEAERLKEINPRAYENEYLGIACGSGAEVFPNLEIRRVTDEEYKQLESVYCGLDFGFAADPSAFVRVAYDRKTETIIFMDEIYKRGQSNRDLYDLIVGHDLNKWLYDPGYWSMFTGEHYGGQLRIVCDCASPKDIADLRSMGLNVAPCHKEAGCVLYRLRWLQHRKIVIDPARCPNAAEEFQNYCYDVDRRTGEILSSVPDARNHTIDAAAYALDKLIYTAKNPA